MPLDALARIGEPARDAAARPPRQPHDAFARAAPARDVHVVRTNRRRALARALGDRRLGASAQRRAHRLGARPDAGRHGADRRSASDTTRSIRIRTERSRRRKRSTRAIAPLRAFMLRQTRAADVALFERVARRGPEPERRAPITRDRPGLRRRRAAQRICDRLRALSAVRRDRPGGCRDADGAGHDDAQPAGRLAAGEAAACS